MKPKTMLLMAIAIGCGLFAAITVSKMVAPKDQKVTVVVAKDVIKRGTVLKDQEWFLKSFDIVQMSQQEITEKGQSDRGLQNKLTGDVLEFLKPKYKDHVIDHAMNPGDVLSADYIVDRKSLGLASLIHPGYTAFSIPVDASSSVAGWLIPIYSWVEVHTTRRTNGGEKIPKVLMKNVRVLAVDQTSEQQPEGARVPTTVTLEVSNAEAKVLRQATDDGQKVTLTLIGTADLEKIVEEDRYDAKNRKGEDDSKKDAKVTLDKLVRPGYTAHSIEVSAKTAGAGLILPENRVKIIGLRKSAKGDRKESYLLMKNVRVLAVDDVTSVDREGERAITAKTITLEVTDAEAKRLVEAQDESLLAVGLIPASELKGKTDEEIDSNRRGDPPPSRDEEQKPVAGKYDPRAPRLSVFISSKQDVYQTDENGMIKPVGGGGVQQLPPVPAGPAPTQAAPAQGPTQPAAPAPAPIDRN